MARISPSMDLPGMALFTILSIHVQSVPPVIPLPRFNHRLHDWLSKPPCPPVIPANGIDVYGKRRLRCQFPETGLEM